MLQDRKNRRVTFRVAGALGGSVFRKVRPGKGYRVLGVADGETTGRVTVLTGKAKPKSRKIYEQALPAGGYGYLTTRDGTQLAISVRLPGPADEGPYPTLVEYAGYGYANPAGAESGISQIANLLGYAVVDVNMRGTGCSGGAFDYFERLQSLDGYDVVETVARQPWVKNDRVGMLGVSYGGISQLFVASTNPPSLAGITPLSVIDNTATTLYPGGILNTGFALEWAEDRVDDSRPASPTQGQDWAWDRIQAGDAACEANQALHTEAVDLLAKIDRNRVYRPKVADPLSPAEFVKRIKAPVFLACQWNDEQTGGHCPNLADRFRSAKRKWFTFTNGLHTDSLDPPTFNRWFDFLELYVDREKPTLPSFVESSAPLLYQTILGVDGVSLPPDPIRAQPTFAAAKRAFEKLPRVRILFDNGAGGAPNKPIPGFERSFKGFPVPGTQARSWFLRDDDPNRGARALLPRHPTLRGKPPKRGASQTFLWDKESRPADNFPGTDTGGGDLWTDDPSYDWRQPPEGTAASYVTAPLERDVGVVGAGALHAWIRASVPNVDLQVTVSDVRPDGKEAYVQSGWLRASLRKLDKRRSTLLEPVLSLRARDRAKLPKGRFAKVVVPLCYQGHVYRAGSRIRITISAPSGDQPVWSFADTVPGGDANVTVGLGPNRKSRLILPVLPKLKAPTPLPGCPALRGRPCRDFAP
jgi:predicted acyl esterase